MPAHATRRKCALLQRFIALTALPCVTRNRQRIPIDRLFSAGDWRRISCVRAIFPCRGFLSFSEDMGMELALMSGNAVLRNSMDVICQSLASREKQA
ncbi:hypothetical protein HBDW_47790 [Herbaspirillum sp. DW155]|uniref:hypothetical protein n=1 Tax=Herbaspirillum sp. DW155 TaxID=3095609 RepID=UPI003092560B|nr:hypothetical protein HBDW_47790 [Herbaspirillum sp. DW155]